MSEQRTIKWYLENQAGLTPEPRIEITQAEAAIREIVISSEEELAEIIAHNAGTARYMAEKIRQAMLEKVGK